jgi:hypothetical protein
MNTVTASKQSFYSNGLSHRIKKTEVLGEKVLSVDSIFNFVAVLLFAMEMMMRSLLNRHDRAVIVVEARESGTKCDDVKSINSSATRSTTS